MSPEPDAEPTPRGRAADWDGKHRWFDGINPIDLECPSPGRLHVRGTITWVVGQKVWYTDPFLFELELCPRTGAFLEYVIRFGDHRPLSSKAKDYEASDPPWAAGCLSFPGVARGKQLVEAKQACPEPRRSPGQSRFNATLLALHDRTHRVRSCSALAE